MRKYLKKFAVSLLFVFLFTASGFSLKVNAVGMNKNLNLPDRVETVRDASKVTKVSLKDSAVSFKDTDTVRLIIELKGKPIISYATSKGVKVNELDKVTRQNLKKTLQAEQKTFKDLLKSKGISIKELESYINVLNGLGVETTFKNAKIIDELSEVSSVSIAHEFDRPEPEMISSKDIVKAVETWTNTGYNGEGMVVAIIDTGLDPSHQDFVLTDASKAKIQTTEIGGFLGTYRNAKVPYGYNYMDNNQEILDLGPEASEHGMHVAGTVGANGDEKNGGIKGIAPEAQLLAMKVFGNNPAMPSTFGDVIIKAIDDSVELGADVINMSLGSSASFVQADDLEQVAVKRAMDNGVISAISAGNSNLFGSGFDDPFASNPDVGVVGSPGIAAESIQVASIENTYISAVALEYMYGGVNSFAPYLLTGTYNPIKIFTGSVTYLHAGLGNPADFAGKDFTGKIALIERGTLDFATKILNAQAAGAIGVIIYNHEGGGEGLINMQYPPEGKIPAVFIPRSHGLKLVENIASGANSVSFKGNTAVALNPDAGKMSDFTSWGTTPSLDFKPEITAPGGNIWSTAQNNGYQSMSGTSMAAPHVAGGSALVLQRVATEFSSLTGAAKVTMAKNLLMSTAVALGDKGTFNENFSLSEYNFTSPRRQGAGVMDLFAATTTPAVVYDKISGESKVSLGEMGKLSTFTLKIDNFSNKKVTYNIKGTVQTDLSDGEYNFTESQGVYIANTVKEKGPNGYWSGKFPISFSSSRVTVQAKGSIEVVVKVDLSKAVDWYSNAPIASVFPNGTFIEGFVTLEDVSDVNPVLSIPYMGFYGDWAKAPVIDASIYDTDETSFYGLTSLAWYEEASDNLNFLGVDYLDNIDKEKIYFSPEKNGLMDNVIPVLSFLRNSKEFEANILDASGKLIRNLYLEENIRKNYYDSGNNSLFTANLSWMWDGTANNLPVAEGQYYYQIKTKVDYPGAVWQVDTFPVKVDNTKPLITGITYDKNTNILKINASDAYSGVSSYEIKDNLSNPLISRDGIFDLTEIGVTTKAILTVMDTAGNTMNYALAEVLKGDNNSAPGGNPTIPNTPSPLSYKEPKSIALEDTTAPVVKITSPEFFGIYASNTIRIQGTIEDASPIDSLKIDGTPVMYIWNNKTGYWTFDLPLTYPDGYHSIQVEVRDQAGNTIAFAHNIFVDATKPVITLHEPTPAETTLEKITLKALFTDNFPSLMVKLNQNMLTNIEPDWSYFNDLKPASYLMEKEVELNMGLNLFILEGEDEAGNVTKIEVKITRVSP